jgi:hypothetical protein
MAAHHSVGPSFGRALPRYNEPRHLSPTHLSEDPTVIAASKAHMLQRAPRLIGFSLSKAN